MDIADPHRRVGPIDDRRQRENCTFGVIKHRVHDGVFNDGDKLLELLIVVQVVLIG